MTDALTDGTIEQTHELKTLQEQGGRVPQLLVQVDVEPVVNARMCMCWMIPVSAPSLRSFYYTCMNSMSPLGPCRAFGGSTKQPVETTIIAD